MRYDHFVSNTIVIIGYRNQISRLGFLHLVPKRTFYWYHFSQQIHLLQKIKPPKGLSIGAKEQQKKMGEVARLETPRWLTLSG